MSIADNLEKTVVPFPRGAPIEAANPEPPAEIESLIRELESMRSEMVLFAARYLEPAGTVHQTYQESARNLLHYVALRSHDLRRLQGRLSALGLSSLGRSESHVLANVDSVMRALHHMAGRPWSAAANGPPAVAPGPGKQLLDLHSDMLLGPAHGGRGGRGVRIMVTMPSEAASDYTLVHRLLEAGMDCMRINCAHDDADAWSRMIEHLRRAEKALGRSARVLMDLAGPKLRTGPIEPGPAVIKFRPERDAFGSVTAPARVWLTAAKDPAPAPSHADACLAVKKKWLRDLSVGDEVRFIDARGAARRLRIVDTADRGAWAESTQTAYVRPGMILSRGRADVGSGVADFAPAEGSIAVDAGDLLVLTRDLSPGRGTTHDAVGRILTPAHIGCTLPEVFGDVHAGEHVWFDDGRIGGIIERAEHDELHVRIVRTRPGGDKLKSDKGINLPDTELSLAALTDKDIQDLEFVARNADIVGLSFASRPEDLILLQKHLERIGGKRPGILVKVETRRAFEQLPALLLTAMRTPASGVMIARGDLAVECGYERLAEVQEEILWMCEAAHLPVVWATQVLETLARDGIPSRAEITDAAMSHRAECVMLNKGPYIVEAIRVLDDILQRMQSHQRKKQSMLRELRLARLFTSPNNGHDRH